MTRFTSRTLDVIGSFAKNMGIGDVCPASDGSITFEFERAGRLCFTPFQAESQVLMSLARDHAHLHYDNLKIFMGMSCWDPYIGVSINAGMTVQGAPILVANISEDSFNLQTLEQCFDRLINLHNTSFA